ncbi:PQQ-binding-like beta-propeller repeat protein [Thermoflexus sp.]|uniref:outer membrane protein assembly factor BamB family protein n=2 Tax=Thermoflexus sp. TaxID=1969742 RepID=UPI0026160F97|nr:PQQ-binding-like beta-propeller repeat protein [Thermoflexus sp.]MCX7690659.1 PQQ-binding-like beta-propeller repeat protein [Thermoflexus sp.]
METQRLDPMQTSSLLRVGEVLQGRYRIERVLGAGGMSTVYLALDLRFSQVRRLCAIKEMISHIPDPRMRALAQQSFEREAALLATLSHPAIPKIYDYFVEGERSYLVMEYIPGQDLEMLLRRTEGMLSVEEVVNWAVQICDVLHYLHSQQPPIIFRDLKPSNIMVDPYGRVFLVDFGIAKVFQAGQRGTMIGTEGYSPPEQYRGVVDPRTDLYALGATLHHLLTRQDPRLEPPFSFHERPIRRINPAVPEALAQVVMRALEYDPERRFQSALEMKQALLAAMGMRTPVRPTAHREAPSGSTPYRVKWAFACEDEIRSRPVVADGVVFVTSYDHNVYALSAKDGKLLWKFATDGGIGGAVAVVQDRVVVGSLDHRLYVLHAREGKLLWTLELGGPIYTTPRISAGLIFLGADDGVFYAVDLNTGRVVWKMPVSAPIRSSAGLYGETVVVGSEDGGVYALDFQGHLRWQFVARRGVTASPWVDEELVVVGSWDWHVYALDARTGWAIWRFRTGKPVLSSPVVSEGVIYVGSADGFLYALNARTGNPIWRFQAGGQVNAPPLALEGRVLVGATDGRLYAVDARTGNALWSFQAGGPIVSAPAWWEGMLYVTSMDYRVYALSLG